MRSRAQLKARASELKDEVAKATAANEDGRIEAKRFKGFIDKAYRENEEIQDELKQWDQVARFSGGTEANMAVSQMPHADGGRIVPASPMDMTAQQIHGLYAAAQARTPYSIEIQPKSYRESIVTKAAVTESGLGGSFSGQLPPIQSQFATGLGFEPTRIADLFPGAAMKGASATWLSHTSNTNPAAIVAEAGAKPDTGMVISENQVIPVKLAALSITTLEAWQDTEEFGEGAFASWLPTELTRALIDVESSTLLNATTPFKGITQVSGTLTRSQGTDSPLDCLAKAFVDLRTGAAFADPDIVLLNPSTLGALRRAKDADGRYILDLLAGPLALTAYGQPSTGGPASEPNPYAVIPQGHPNSSGNLWGAQIYTTTHLAAGTAIVASVKAGAGIFWQRHALTVMFNPWSLMSSNEMQWVCEERVAYSCNRSAALNIVTGLPTS